MIFKVRFEVLGGHVHCDVFVGKAYNQTFANCGHLVIDRGQQWTAFEAAFAGAEFEPKHGDPAFYDAARKP
jgi:hypothetical protein